MKTLLGYRRDSRTSSNLSRRGRRAHRAAAVLEAVESRTLLSIAPPLLMDPNGPVMFVDGGGVLTATQYDSSSHALTSTGTIVTFITAPASNGVPADSISGNFNLNVGVSNTGVIIPSAVGTNDLTVTGTAVIGGTTYSGTLLSGHATDFGYANDPNAYTNELVSFQFTPTGGLLASQWVPDNIGMNLNIEASNFTGTFATNFNGAAKATIGGVPGTTGGQPAGLGDFVWLDKNHNGIQDSGEPGINGVTVKLLDSSGNPLGPTTVTANNGTTDGYYQFTNLAPGSYKVQFVVPAGYTQSLPFQGSNTALDSNAAIGTGITDTVTLAAGQFNPTIDAGLYKTTNISGHKYQDVTGNGFSTDDTALGGVTINLYNDANGDGIVDGTDHVVDTTTTATDGSYFFSEANGKYIVKEVVPTGWIRTGPALTDGYAVCVTTGSNATCLDFDNYNMECNISNFSNVCFTITDGCNTYKVSDLRGNTHQGDSVTVSFTLKQTDTVTFVSYTAPDNYFNADHAFAQNIYQVKTQTFGPGTHTLTIKIPCCYYQIDFVCGTVIDQLGPNGSNIFYTPQQRLISADNGGTTAPNFGVGSLSGTVFVNTNGSANYQTSDVELSGIKVTLTGYDSVTKQNITIITYTDVNGDFYFDNLDAGTYKITEGATTGYKDGTDYIGTLGGTTGNDNFSNIVVKAGQNGFNYNFGEQKS